MLRIRGICVVGMFGVLAVFLSARVEGQDAHYWTDQLGNRAQLLGGAVIGSDENLSSVFYNPGRIGRGVNPELIITGNIFELENLKVEDVSEDRSVDQLRFRGLPSLFAGEVYGKWLGQNRLAYSFFTRTDASFRSTERFGDEFAPGDFEFEFFEDELQIDSSLNESWAGLTWSRAIGSKKRGVGVSMFVAVRNDRSRVTTVRQAIFDTGDLGIRYDNQEFDYYNWRLLWKAGYSTEIAGWRLGATLTTPGINLFGDGSVSFDDSLVTTSDDDGLNDRIISNSQSGLSSTYKSPASVGFGASRDFKSWSLHFSMEWFDSISSYQVLDAEPFENQETGETIDPNIFTAADSVTNAALGYEKRFKNGNRAYGSLRTDFSSAPGGDETNLATTDWDLFHLGGGFSFGLGKTAMTLGAVYAWGTSEPSPILNDPDDEVRLGYNRLTFIIGFDLPTRPPDRLQPDDD